MILVLDLMIKVCSLRNVTRINLAIWNFIKLFIMLSSILMDTLILLSGYTCYC